MRTVSRAVAVMGLCLGLLLTGCSARWRDGEPAADPTPAPNVPWGKASPCGWQLVNQDIGALPDDPDRLWVCGMGWDFQPLTGQGLAELMTAIRSQIWDRNQACTADAHSPRFAVYLDAGQQRIGLRTDGGCQFGPGYRADAAVAAIRAAFTSAFGPGDEGSGDSCRSQTSAASQQLTAAATVTGCVGQVAPDTGLNQTAAVRATATELAILTKVSTSWASSSPTGEVPATPGTVLRVRTDRGTTTWWFDGTRVWIDAEWVTVAEPSGEALAVLHRLTGR